MDPTIDKPEWTPEGAGPEFASFVMKGVSLESNVSNRPRNKKKELGLEDYVKGVLQGNRTILARAITLIESNAPAHRNLGQEVLQALLPHSGNSIRVGITGVPGAGKSTFVESVGSQLCKKNHRVAVLAVDPSSSLSGGSILGDKTRMERLSRDTRAFIRPSPTGGNLGGVAEKSRSTILLCEAAGYDTILVETVGVGQNETMVRQMVDCFLLLGIAGAGDDLQGIKKGVVELADLFVVNKADGSNKVRAARTRSEMATVLHYLTPFTPGWKVPALTCSALTGEGIDEVWNTVKQFLAHLATDQLLQQRRAAQNVDWMHDMVFQELKHQFRQNPQVLAVLPSLETEVASGRLPAYQAACQLLERFLPGNLDAIQS
jgi:LAO/AO transport system kinase